MTKVKCMICGQILESKHRYDFVECSCKATFLDGGNDYIRTSIYGDVIFPKKTGSKV